MPTYAVRTGTTKVMDAPFSASGQDPLLISGTLEIQDQDLRLELTSGAEVGRCDDTQGTILLRTGSSLELAFDTTSGQNGIISDLRIEIEPNALLTISGKSKFGDDVVTGVSGILSLNNKIPEPRVTDGQGKPTREFIPPVDFWNQAGLLGYSRSRAQYLIRRGGTLQGTGLIEGTVILDGGEIIVEIPGKAQPVPTATYMSLSGDLIGNGGTLTINADADYYGQFSAMSAVLLTGSTLNVVTNPSNLTLYPMDIIHATNIYGAFSSNSGRASSFTHRTVTGTSPSQYYHITT